MLGLVTIGQAPREDIVASMFECVTPRGIAQAGALDPLNRDEIAALSPTEGEHLLVTRLADGSEVTVAKERLLPLLDDAVWRAEAAGATVVCVLCTGEFPTLTTRAKLIFPDRVLAGVTEAVAPDGTIGVLMPHERQHDAMVAKWSSATRRVVTATASPYSAPDAIAGAARELSERGVELVVMDCMGFDRRMQAQARGAVDVPVALANGLVGAVLRELVDLSAG